MESREASLECPRRLPERTNRQGHSHNLTRAARRQAGLAPSCLHTIQDDIRAYDHREPLCLGKPGLNSGPTNSLSLRQMMDGTEHRSLASREATQDPRSINS